MKRLPCGMTDSKCERAAVKFSKAARERESQAETALLPIDGAGALRKWFEDRCDQVLGNAGLS